MASTFYELLYARPRRPVGDRSYGRSRDANDNGRRAGRKNLLLFIVGPGCLGTDTGADQGVAGAGIDEIHPRRTPGRADAARRGKQTTLVVGTIEFARRLCPGDADEPAGIHFFGRRSVHAQPVSPPGRRSVTRQFLWLDGRR